MNRFHLLSVDGEETTGPAATTAKASHAGGAALAASTAAAASKKAGPRGGNRDGGRNDRKSRGAPRRPEGEEKHYTVGRGSWGRRTDGAMPEGTEGEAETEETVAVAEGEEQSSTPAAPPKPVYKTVAQHLAEQAEQRRGLAARTSQPQTRQANEGAKLDSDLQVLRKETEVLQFGPGPAKKNSTLAAGSAAAPKESTTKRLTLQELTKTAPAASEARPDRRRDDASARRDEGAVGGRTGRPQGGDKERRFADKKDAAPPLSTPTATKKVNLSDKTAFPSLA